MLLRVFLVVAATVLPSAATAVEPLPVDEVADGVFVHQGEVALASPGNLGAIANVGFVIGDSGVAVIDPGGSVAEGKALLAAIRKRTDLPVRFVIYTHMHPDHVLGAGAFDAALPAPEILAHENLSRSLAARADHYLASARRALGEEIASELEIVMPDRLVEDQATLELGGRALVLTAWPTAHTNNDLTALDTRTGTLFAGDLVFLDHLPVIDGSIVGWLEIHDGLAGLDADRVVPGHGPASAPWPDALDPQRRYLRSLAAGVRREVSAGSGLAEAVEALPDPDGPWSLVDEFHRRNITTAFTELEWE